MKNDYEKIRTIVQQSGMSARPEYYSGRGATLSDLNSDILEKIYQQITKEFDETAGVNFISMVEEIEELSATRFLNSLYMLCENDWNWSKDKEGSSIAFDNEVGALATVFSGLYGNKRNDTATIKNMFLSNHGIQMQNIYGDEYGNCFVCY